MLECAVSAALTPIAWYCGHSARSTHPVASLAANDWGLYDMLGNVGEMVHDYYQEDLGSEPVTDPHGPVTGSQWVLRGGHWIAYAKYLRAAERAGVGPDGYWDVIGFRVARSLP